MVWQAGRPISVGGRQNDPNSAFQLQGQVTDVQVRQIMTSDYQMVLQFFLEQVFSRTLTEDEAVGFTSCNDKLTGRFKKGTNNKLLYLSGDIASWEENGWQIEGNISMASLQLRKHRNHP